MTAKPTIITADEMKAEISKTQYAIDGLRRAVLSSNANAAFRGEFLSFAKEWEDYLATIMVKSSTLTWRQQLNQKSNPLKPTSDERELPFFLSTIWDQVQDYQARTKEWRDNMERQGVVVLSVEPDVAVPDNSSFKMPWWVYVTGAGLVIYKLSPLKTAHSIRSLMPSKKNKK